jgi:hypothetical protein
MNILKFNSFIYEELKIKDLDLRTKSEIIINFKKRILELKQYWKDSSELSIYDRRNILRQFINEFTKEMIDELQFESFLEESSIIFKDKKVLIKHINKYLESLDKI